jgi:hypothetical protein
MNITLSVWYRDTDWWTIEVRSVNICIEIDHTYMYVCMNIFYIYVSDYTDSNNGGKLQGCCGKFNVVRICTGGTN